MSDGARDAWLDSRMTHKHLTPTRGQWVCVDTGEFLSSADIVFTDHDRPGSYNACRHCHENQDTIAQSLAKLNDSRKP